MHICIDARFWGLSNTGLGRYTMHLITELLQFEQKHHYTLLINPASKDHISDTLSESSQPYTLLEADARHYSLKEQVLIPQKLYQLQPDLLHVPHFNIPVAWPGKFVVTIHDLIKQSSVGAQTTTLPMPLYWTKYYVHNLVIAQAINRSQAILTPSEYTKQQIIKHYNTDDQKIHVTPEAPASTYSNLPQKKFDISKYQLDSPYLIYTGNLYPHKNITRLIYALKNHNQISEKKVKLALVCARDTFQEQLKKFVHEIDMAETVVFLGFIPDEELKYLYHHSLAFITPSFIEGFGLPGLEALAASTLVLSSNTTSLPEVYQNNPFYFDPHSQEQIAAAIDKALNLSPTQRKSKITSGKKHAATFSWQQMARQTLSVYNSLNDT